MADVVWYNSIGPTWATHRHSLERVNRMTSTTTSPKVVTITTAELAEKLVSPRGGNRITVKIKSTPKMLVKGRDSKLPNPFGVVTKVTTMHGMIGSSYSNGVNNQLVREGKDADFVPQSHRWATHYVGALMTANKDNALVLAFRGLEAKHTNKSVFFDANDKELTREELAEYLPVPRSGNQSQGTDKEVIWITPKLASIIEVVMDGVTYKIANPKVVTISDVAHLVGQSPKVATP